MAALTSHPVAWRGPVEEPEASTCSESFILVQDIDVDTPNFRDYLEAASLCVQDTSYFFSTVTLWKAKPRWFGGPF